MAGARLFGSVTLGTALGAFAVAPAAAWAPETRVAMIDDAVKLMPASLRLALEHHREALLGGMLTPALHEDAPEHRPPWAEGTLDASVEHEAEALLELLGRQSSFTAIAREFGGVAHYVADTSFPPGATRTDGARRYAHFSSFCESRRPRFPLVFYGHEDAHLARSDWAGFARANLETASRDDAQLSRAYAAAGEPPDPAAFDDRSVPFAVGSLAYSQSVTRIVRVWLALWQQAGGAIGRTPYLATKPAAAKP